MMLPMLFIHTKTMMRHMLFIHTHNNDTIHALYPHQKQ